MTKNPENVLPEMRLSSFEEIEEVRSEVSVEHQLHQGDRDGWKGKNDQKADN